MRKHLIFNGLKEDELRDLCDDPKLTLHQPCSVLEQAVKLTIKSLASRTSSSANNTDDLEKGKRVRSMANLRSLQSRIHEANGSSVLRRTSLALLFVGIIASVVGYVGCFSAVQGSRSSKEALIWLCLEAGLSIIRIALWGINPKGDDAPPLEFTFKLDKHAPLPTCCKPAEEIEELKILPLVRATEFLEAITSYAGLLHQFSPPTLTLYYTLTRRNHAAPNPNSNSESSPSERVLYITIFDHTERTTRVYSENYHRIQKRGTDDGIGAVSNDENDTSPSPSYFYSADPVTVDLEHGILKTRIGDAIQHKDDPIAGNTRLRMLLAKHYHSILNQVNSRIKSESDALENDWTLRLGEVESRMQKGKERGVAADGDGSNDRATRSQVSGSRSAGEEGSRPDPCSREMGRGLHELVA
jgi:hypothetical protein